MRLHTREKTAASLLFVRVWTVHLWSADPKVETDLDKSDFEVFTDIRVRRCRLGLILL